MITFYPRSNTQDSFIIKEVYEDNCYNLPDDMSDDVVVIDIGANIGAFVVACMERNVKKVMAYEPNMDNFKLLFRHVNQVEGWGRVVEIYNNAVCNKAGHSYVSDVNFLGEIELTGGFVSNSELNFGAYKIICTTLDDILSSLHIETKMNEVWIKLDCEGAEHEIIQSVINADALRSYYKLLEFYNVTKIFGEVHTTIEGKICSIGPKVNFTLPSIDDFKLKLDQLGFKVRVQPHEIDPHLALFWAEKG